MIYSTTPEHPFWVEHEGWTPADVLKAGDRLATLASEWVTVEEAYDTGEYETVYNCRVAAYHTYFVGDETHIVAIWAHNRYSAVMSQLDDAFGSGQNEPLNGLVLLDVLSQRMTAVSVTAEAYAEDLREAVAALGLRSSKVTETAATRLHALVRTHGWKSDDFAKQLRETFRWSLSDRSRLSNLENLWSLTRKSRADRLDHLAFGAELDRMLHALDVLPSGTTLQSTSVNLIHLHNAARQHGNTGRSPLVYWDPHAGNPYRAGTQYHGYYDRIRALATAGVPGAVQMFQSLRHPTQRYGIPFHLDRAEHYRQQETLVGIEVPTVAPDDKRGYVDLLLSGGTAIDCKAWTNFHSYSSDDQNKMKRSLVAAAQKYLGSANVSSLIFEFKGAIPADVEDFTHQRVSVPTGKTLRFVAIPA